MSDHWEPEGTSDDHHRRGDVLELMTGITVCLETLHGDSWECVIVDSANAKYRPGGYNILVSTREIRDEGRRVQLA